ncbi:MAG: histidine kinase [Spirochaetota bacterium]
MKNRSFRDRIQDALRSSLLTRFTVVFIATILVPSLAIIAYSTVDTARNTTQSVMANSRSIAEDVFDSVAASFTAGRDLAQQIAFDSRLRRFLGEDFAESGEAVVEFLQTIRPILDYAVRFKGSGIEGARVIMANPTQPESWPYFVSERRMLGTEWYQRFRQSDATSIWLYPNLSGVYSPYDLEQIVRRPVYTHVRKIFDIQGAYLGSVIVDVLEREVHSSMHDLALESIDFANAQRDGEFWHAAVDETHELTDRERTEWREAIGAIASESGGRVPATGEAVATAGAQYAYLWRTVSDPNLLVSARVHLREQIVESAASKILVGLVVVLGVIALEILTYLILKSIFDRLSKMTGIMNQVAGGEFHHRIPVETRDEIGQIAEDFNVLIKRIDELVTESVLRETAQKDTQLKALQFQINPHFIYNTIDTFRMRALMAHQDDLADGLASFGKLIRYNSAGDSLFTLLADEISVIEQYVGLEQLRCDGQVHLSTARAHAHGHERVLKFVLQPLVENSIRHGKRDDVPIAIDVSARRSNGTLSVVVNDDGVGIAADRLCAIREHIKLGGAQLDVDGENGIGLANIASRLRLFYGASAAMLVESTEGVGTSVELRLPVEGAGHS